MTKAINNKVYDTDECLFIGREVDGAKAFFKTKDGEYLMVIPKHYEPGDWKKVDEEDELRLIPETVFEFYHNHIITSKEYLDTLPSSDEIYKSHK